MKKFLFAVVIAGALSACNDTGSANEDNKKDSIENKTDSMQEQIQENADSAKEKLERRADSLEAKMDQKDSTKK